MDPTDRVITNNYCTCMYVFNFYWFCTLLYIPVPSVNKVFIIIIIIIILYPWVLVSLLEAKTLSICL